MSNKAVEPRMATTDTTIKVHQIQERRIQSLKAAVRKTAGVLELMRRGAQT